jgi:hypothetical protein
MLAFFPPSFFAGIPAPVLAHVAVLAQPERRAGRSARCSPQARSARSPARSPPASCSFPGSARPARWRRSPPSMCCWRDCCLPSWRAGRRSGRGRAVFCRLGVAALELAARSVHARERLFLHPRHRRVGRGYGRTGAADGARPSRPRHHGARRAAAHARTPHAAMLDMLARARMEGRSSRPSSSAAGPIRCRAPGPKPAFGRG